MCGIMTYMVSANELYPEITTRQRNWITALAFLVAVMMVVGSVLLYLGFPGADLVLGWGNIGIHTLAGIETILVGWIPLAYILPVIVPLVVVAGLVLIVTTSYESYQASNQSCVKEYNPVLSTALLLHNQSARHKRRLHLQRLISRSNNKEDSHVSVVLSFTTTPA